VFGAAGPTPVDVIREIEQLADVGVQHIALNFDNLDGIRRFVLEVVPNVRLWPSRANDGRSHHGPGRLPVSVSISLPLTAAASSDACHTV